MLTLLVIKWPPLPTKLVQKLRYSQAMEFTGRATTVQSTVCIVSTATYGANTWVLCCVLLSLCACAVAQLKGALQFSPVDSFAMILRKIAAQDFASEKLPRHSAMWRQIKSLLQSPAGHRSLCSALHRELFKPTLGEGQVSVSSRLWLQFHIVRELVRRWSVLGIWHMWTLCR